MTEQSRLLPLKTSVAEQREIRNAAYVKTGRERGIILRIDLDHDRATSKVCRRFYHFRSCHATGAAPRRPEIDENGYGCIARNLVESLEIHIERRIEGRKFPATTTASPDISQVPGGNAVPDTAMRTGAYHGLLPAIADAPFRRTMPSSFST